MCSFQKTGSRITLWRGLYKDLLKQKRQAPALQENAKKLNDLHKNYKNQLKAQETKLGKVDQERSKLKNTLDHQKVAATKQLKDLNECRNKLKVYEKKETELNRLINELGAIESNMVDYNNQSQELLDLKHKLALTSTWCDNVEREMDELFLFAEQISENIQHGGEDLGLLIHKMSQKARESYFRLDPLSDKKMGKTIVYERPRWLTNKLTQKSLESAEEKLKILSLEDSFRDRLEKRLELFSKITPEPDSEGENHHNHHSDEECENGEDDDDWHAQRAWNHACSSDEEEQDNSPGFLCKYCERKEPSIRELSDHNFDHLKNPPFNCNICPYSNNKMKKIKVHMRRHREENNQIVGQAQAPWVGNSDNGKLDVGNFVVPKKKQPNRKPPDPQGRSLRPDAPDWFYQYY